MIDDVPAALARLSPLGRELLAPSFTGVESAVLRHAELRGWAVASHASFAQWAGSVIKPSAGPWLVLDPLFATPSEAIRVHVARSSRSFSGEGAVGYDESPLPLSTVGSVATG